DGNFLTVWGKFGFAWKGASQGVFDNPWGVAVDKDDNIYIADTLNNRVQKYTAEGEPLLMWGKEGAFDGAFFYCRGLAWHCTGNGFFGCQWGNRGKTVGQLNFPYGIAVDREGFVYVVDSGNARVLKYAPVEGHHEPVQAYRAVGELPAPSSLTAKAADTEVTLGWLDVPGAASYNLYYHTEPGVTKQIGT